AKLRIILLRRKIRRLLMGHSRWLLWNPHRQTATLYKSFAHAEAKSARKSENTSTEVRGYLADISGRMAWSLRGMAGGQSPSTPLSAGSGSGLHGWQHGSGGKFSRVGTGASHSVSRPIWNRSLVCSSRDTSLTASQRLASTEMYVVTDVARVCWAMTMSPKLPCLMAR